MLSHKDAEDPIFVSMEIATEKKAGKTNSNSSFPDETKPKSIEKPKQMCAILADVPYEPDAAEVRHKS